MSGIYAMQFSEIQAALSQNSTLRSAVIQLVTLEPVAGKVTEGGNRLFSFRAILTELVIGKITLIQAINSTEVQLSDDTSMYSGNNRVFASGWAERLVRTQLSRFYNQAVMKTLLDAGETMCFVPHSSEEASDSPCSLSLAGQNHNIKVLYNRLISAYADGNWSKDLKIPNHPHCTHVIAPVQ